MRFRFEFRFSSISEMLAELSPVGLVASAEWSVEDAYGFPSLSSAQNAGFPGGTQLRASWFVKGDWAAFIKPDFELEKILFRFEGVSSNQKVGISDSLIFKRHNGSWWVRYSARGSRFQTDPVFAAQVLRGASGPLNLPFELVENDAGFRVEGSEEVLNLEAFGFLGPVNPSGLEWRIPEGVSVISYAKTTLDFLSSGRIFYCRPTFLMSSNEIGLLSDLLTNVKVSKREPLEVVMNYHAAISGFFDRDGVSPFRETLVAKAEVHFPGGDKSASLLLTRSGQKIDLGVYSDQDISEADIVGVL